MEDLILRAWELPPHCEAPLVARADASVEIEWRGQPTEVLVRSVKIARGVFWMFFQPREEPTTNFVVRIPTAWPVEPHAWKEHKTLAECARIVRLAAQQKQFQGARFFYLGEPQNAVAFFTPADDPNLCGWVNKRWPVSYFPVRRATKSWDSPRLHRWLLQGWNKADSEIRFAWEWAQWSEEGRLAWVYNQPRDLKELMQVMNWALKSEPTIGNDEEWRWYLDSFSCLDDAGDADRFWPESEAAHSPWINEDMSQKSPRLWALRQFLVSNFLPLPPLRLAKPPLCVREFDSLHRSHIMARREVQTAHEQLEAAMKLRDWLRQNDAPAELLALL